MRRNIGKSKIQFILEELCTKNKKRVNADGWVLEKNILLKISSEFEVTSGFL